MYKTFSSKSYIKSYHLYLRYNHVNCYHLFLLAVCVLHNFAYLFTALQTSKLQETNINYISFIFTIDFISRSALFFKKKLYRCDQTKFQKFSKSSCAFSRTMYDPLGTLRKNKNHTLLMDVYFWSKMPYILQSMLCCQIRIKKTFSD